MNAKVKPDNQKDADSLCQIEIRNPFHLPLFTSGPYFGMKRGHARYTPVLPTSFSSDFNFFLHVDFLTVLIVELVLKEGKLLAWNDADPKTILELPLAAQA